MKYLILIALLGISLHTKAQKLNKAEKAALKAEISKMLKDPEQYKELKERIEKKRKQSKELDAQIGVINNSVKNKQVLLERKDKRIKELGDEIARLELENKERQKAIESHSNTQGIVYKVQIEVDESFLYSETDPVTGNKKVIFTSDPENTDGTRKYTLGYFSDKEEAETFKEYLRLLRVRDAIVVAYQ